MLNPQAIQSVREYLAQFAAKDDFEETIASIFGTEIDRVQLLRIRAQWLERDFSDFPPIEIRSRSEINGADGAFAIATGKIYLAQELVDSSNFTKVVSVVLEEYGHSIDAKLNTIDTPGDEGAIFSALVRGETLSTSELSTLKAKDDRVTIQLDGKAVSIEQAITPIPNPFYEYKVVAATGDLGITAFTPYPSINDNGTVAFIGLRSGVSDIFAYSGGLIDVTGPTDTAPNSKQSVQINNNDKIVTYDSKGNSLGKFDIGVRIRDVNDPTSIENVVTTVGFFKTFNLVLPFPSINNNNDVIFTGLISDVSTERVLATPTFFGYNYQSLERRGGAAPQPMIADNGAIVVQDGKVGSNAIRIYSELFAPSITTIASPSNGFTSVGASPGISDDGKIVTFYGDLSTAGATALAADPGKGIFAAINTTDGWKIQRIAGIAGNGFLDPGETYLDNNHNGKFDAGDTEVGVFSDFVPDVRVAVNSTENTQRAVTIAYEAYDKAGNKGIYTNRLNIVYFFDAIFPTIPFNPFYAGNLNFVSSPTLVAEVGQDIERPKLTGKITDLNIYDPLNSRDRGEVAFWVNTTGGEGIIRALHQEVIYLDFDPVNNFSAGLDPGADLLFAEELAAPLTKWTDNIDGVFAKYAPLRADLKAIGIIEDNITAQVQKVFNEVGANVKVLSSNKTSVPTDGQFTRVYIGGSDTKKKNLLGVASSVDLFNQDIKQSGYKFSLFDKNDTAFVFVNNIFDPVNFNFTDSGGKSVGLDTTGDGAISFVEVISAITNTIAHELGHSFGLSHLRAFEDKLLMTRINKPDSGRNFQSFSKEDREVKEVSKDFKDFLKSEQNDRSRLALSIGTEEPESVVPRTPPSKEIVNSFLKSPYSLSAALSVGAINVQKAVLGISRSGDYDILPEIIDLGSGDLATLLNRKIGVAANAEVFLLASTDGKGIDIMGSPTGSTLDLTSIDRTNGLFLLTDDEIRSNLFDTSGQPLASSFDIFKVTATSSTKIGSVGSADGVVTNIPPVAKNDTALTKEDTAVNINVLANDSDANGDPLTLSLATAPTHGIATINDNGTPTNPSDDFITYTPTANYNGTDSFTYQISDGKATATATVALTITPVNDAPVTQADKSITIKNTTPTPLDIAAPTDVEGDPLTISVSTLPDPTKAKVQLASGKDLLLNQTLTIAELTGLIITPVSSADGTAGTFSYSVNDGNGGVSSQTVTLNILASEVGVTIFGTTGADNLVGTSGDDFIFGDAGNDIINGGAGNDTLFGNAGVDLLFGGAGNDVFGFNNAAEGIDKINDFVVGEDRIGILRDGFGGNAVFGTDSLEGSVLDPSRFTIGTSATTSSQRFIYNNASGALFFDADGVGGANQVRIAQLVGNPNLTNSSFVMMTAMAG